MFGTKLTTQLNHTASLILDYLIHEMKIKKKTTLKHLIINGRG